MMGLLFASGLLFWFARTTTHFLGDGYLILRYMSEIKSGVTTIANCYMHEPLVGFLIFHLERILSIYGIDNSIELTYRVLSIFSGMVFLVLVWHLTKYISRDYFNRVLTLLFLFATGTSQLFFGYVENYPLTVVGIVSFLMASIVYFRKDISIVFPVTVFSFLLVIHFGAIIFLPAMIPLLWKNIKKKKNSIDNYFICYCFRCYFCCFVDC